jgi:hypothetical protein
VDVRPSKEPLLDDDLAGGVGIERVQLCVGIDVRCLGR